MFGQTLEQARAEGRKERAFWSWDDEEELRPVIGLECPDNPKAWWVPELGYTMWEGTRLFPTKQEARSKLIGILYAKVTLYHNRLMALVQDTEG